MQTLFRSYFQFLVPKHAKRRRKVNLKIFITFIKFSYLYILKSFVVKYLMDTERISNIAKNIGAADLVKSEVN